MKIRILVLISTLSIMQSCINKGNIISGEKSVLGAGDSANTCNRFAPKTFSTRSIASQEEELRGILNVNIVDNFINPVAEHDYSLTLDDGSYVSLKGDNAVYSKLIDQAGREVILEGTQVNDSFIATSAYRNIDVNNQRMFIQEKKPKVLFVLMNFDNCKTTDFYGIVKGEELSNYMKDYYFRNSFGQIQVNNDVDNNGKPDVAVVNISGNLQCATSALNWYANNVPGMVTGYNKNDYTHFAYIAVKSASGNACSGYNGVAQFNGAHQFIPDPRAKIVIVHEFGHNLALYHASRDLNGNGKIDSSVNEVYGDHSCIMGNDFSGAVPHVNATNTLKLGLLDTHNLGIQEITQSGTYHLSPLAGDKNTPDVKVLQLKGLAKNFQIAYRAKVNEDSDLNNGFVGLNIYEGKVFNNGSSYGSTGSFNHKTLSSANGVFSDSETGLKVTLLSSSASTAEVKIEIPSSGGNSGGTGGTPNPPTNPNCVKKAAGLTVDKIVYVTDDSFEVRIDIKNNDVACDDGIFNLSVTSADFELKNPISNLKIASGSSSKASLTLILKGQPNKTILEGSLNLSQAGSVVDTKKIEVKFNNKCNK